MRWWCGNVGDRLNAVAGAEGFGVEVVHPEHRLKSVPPGLRVAMLKNKKCRHECGTHVPCRHGTLKSVRHIESMFRRDKPLRRAARRQDWRPHTDVTLQYS